MTIQTDLPTVETFVFDSMLLIETKYGESITETDSLSVGDLRPHGGEDSSEVALRFSKRVEYSDGSTGFDNFSEALYLSRENALKFALLILNKLS